MKVQTEVLLLCFLSGVFLSVVQAKPSPALMRELVDLEKYLEKKEASEGTDGQNENQDEMPTEQELTKNNEQEEEKNSAGNENKPKNENNNNGGTNTAEGSGTEAEDSEAEAGVPPAKPEEDGPPEEPTIRQSENGEHYPSREQESSARGVKGEGNLSLEGNKLNPSKGQVENGRGPIYEILDEFQNVDRKFTELENNSKKAKEKTNEKIGQLKTLLEEINRSTVGLDETPSFGKESVRENVPARRSHISDTEFLNILHSLLTYS
ncbi:hypothetical protein CHS0354_019879 [Potamilus streckersoni]|uniref:Uncharacterized protein n=1 Tax=Potamilus streckersoni TaxID=2493646 RepID=A0AAE0TIY5_9BIVA|nr:hypothetical protein CHS0354_019879 [Potamilus streckersoni]